MAAKSGPKNVLTRENKKPARTGRAPSGRTGPRAAVSRKNKRAAYPVNVRVAMKMWLANANYIEETRNTPQGTDKRSRNSEGEQWNTGRNSKKERKTKNRDIVRALRQPDKFHAATAPPIARSPCSGRGPGKNRKTVGNLDGREIRSEKRTLSAVGSTVPTTDARANRPSATRPHCPAGCSIPQK